tara:strand:+ start:108 stop:569 length:462 start_codon:yes stop_codon:yes gene_type:complete
MKKLILLITLFFIFPTQSFAVTFCPDGSMPTRAISMDGSYYEYKCRGKQNKSNTSSNYGPKRLFASGTGWVLNATGRITGTNGLSCAFINPYQLVGTCNNGINYGLCSLNGNAGICGSDGTTYSFSNDGYSVRSSFGSRCNISSTSTEVFFNC